MGSPSGRTALAVAVAAVLVALGAGSAAADGPLLTLTVSSPSTVSQGDMYTTTVVLQNTGTVAATGGDLTVTTPTSDVATPTGFGEPFFSCGVSGNVVHCPGFTLDPGASATMTIGEKAIGAPSTHLVTTASASSAEGASAQNSSDTVVAGTPSVAYSMGESIAPNTVSPGGSATISVSAANTGVDGTSMYVVLSLGPGTWSLGGASQLSGPPFSCSTDQYDMTCSIGTWPAGTSATFSVPVTLGASAAPGTILNSRDGVFQGAAGGSSLASASASLLVVAPGGGGGGGGTGGGGGGGGSTTATLTVARGGAGSGAITSAPAGINCGTTCSHAYPSGTSVTLTETAATGSVFAGWGGACGSAGTASTCTVTPTADAQVSAAFDVPPPPAPPDGVRVSTPLGPTTQHGRCTVARLPDRDCTPGAVFAAVTSVDLCSPGYASGVGAVSAATRKKVLAAYGIPSSRAARYVLDHLVPVGLGGSNDRGNLWPEATAKPPAAHQKDRLEAWLFDRVCSGAIPLDHAQNAVAENWLAEYHRARLG